MVSTRSSIFLIYETETSLSMSITMNRILKPMMMMAMMIMKRIVKVMMDMMMTIMTMMMMKTVQPVEMLELMHVEEVVHTGQMVHVGPVEWHVGHVEGHVVPEVLDTTIMALRMVQEVQVIMHIVVINSILCT